MNRYQFERYLNELLKPEQINDFCPNGLQIEGKDHIQKVITGVTASQALIEHAIEQEADAILVHHGYFWKNESPVIKGMKYNRIKALITHGINLFAYHLPLDIHPELGNNAQLANLLNIHNTQPLEQGNPLSVSMKGEFSQTISAQMLSDLINSKLDRQCLHIAPSSDKAIKTIAWCSGGGQNYIELAAAENIDAFLTGEVSEQTTHIAREMDIHFFSAGHHATERYGVKALAKHLCEHTSVEAKFIDIDNPV